MRAGGEPGRRYVSAAAARLAPAFRALRAPKCRVLIALPCRAFTHSRESVCSALGAVLDAKGAGTPWRRVSSERVRVCLRRSFARLFFSNSCGHREPAGPVRAPRRSGLAPSGTPGPRARVVGVAHVCCLFLVQWYAVNRPMRDQGSPSLHDALRGRSSRGRQGGPGCACRVAFDGPSRTASLMICSGCAAVSLIAPEGPFLMKRAVSLLLPHSWAPRASLAPSATTCTRHGPLQMSWRGVRAVSVA